MDAIKLNKSDFAKLRRVALHRQGLTTSAPFGRGKNAAERAINHLGYVQIDTISVVERAHHHVLHSRVPNYHPKHLDQLLNQGRVFEYWAHAAAFLPIDAYRYTLPFKQAIKNGKRHWYKNPDYKLMAKILKRIEDEGPLQSKDIEGGKAKAGGWWEWKPGKRALEQLYFQGDLMVSARHGFQKSYDLPERVLPDSVDSSMPSYEEYATYLLDQQLDCHGFASLKGITYLRRDDALRRATKQKVETRLANKTLVACDGGDTYYAQPSMFEEKAPPAPARMRILSPFDNAVIQRDRLTGLFDFDYQIECYVPAAKRKFGYFCLPLLYRDQFVGRIDAKVHRAERRLQIKAVHLESASDTNLGAQVNALADALPPFMAFQGADTLTLDAVFPAKLKQELSAKLKPLT